MSSIISILPPQLYITAPIRRFAARRGGLLFKTGRVVIASRLDGDVYKFGGSWDPIWGLSYPIWGWCDGRHRYSSYFL